MSATLIISSHAAAVATRALATFVGRITPQWTWNKRIAAVMKRADDAEREADRIMRECVG